MAHFASRQRGDSIMMLRIATPAALALAIAACATPPADQSSQASPPPPAAAAPPQPAAQPDASRAPATVWKTNAAAIAIIKESEGLRLEAYTDGVRWLIGYGHTATAKKGMRITETQAEELLRRDLAVCENAIAGAISVPVTENEFGAMASLCYNLGTGNFAKSPVVAKINAGDYAGAADAFLTHTRGTMNGVKQEIPHLKTRREKERALFLTP
jgi:lysozyme